MLLLPPPKLANAGSIYLRQATSNKVLLNFHPLKGLTNLHRFSQTKSLISLRYSSRTCQIAIVLPEFYPHITVEARSLELIEMS